MINKKRIDYITSLGRTDCANCWGSTQYVLNVISKPIWQDDDPMNKFLKNNTTKVTKNKIGDILVLRGSRSNLIHTAVYYGKGIWWHKPGGWPAEFTSEEKVVKMYDHYTARVEYRRFTNTRITRRAKTAPVPVIPPKEKFIYRMYRMFLDLAKIK